MSYVAVVGPGDASDEEERLAEAVGRELAENRATVVCGGLGGVMAAACRGAATVGGVSVAILPGSDRAAANQWATIAIPTGLGELRNGLVVRAADAVIAVGGGHLIGGGVDRSQVAGERHPVLLGCVPHGAESQRADVDADQRL